MKTKDMKFLEEYFIYPENENYNKSIINDKRLEELIW